ncbi:MAG TPA: GtrA family protein [Actinocrinis sp.]|nr:GtrA family protein [Actinocrinis sp.]
MRARGGTFLRYAAGSVVAFGCSEMVLIGSYTLFGAGARLAAVLAWLAGAVPNYVLNRRWAWRERGRAAFLRETLPYWAITLGTAAFAVGATSLADGWVHRSVAGRGEQSLLFGAVYFLAYGVVFVVKFVLFDKLVFGRRGAAESGPVEPSAEDADPDPVAVAASSGSAPQA